MCMPDEFSDQVFFYLFAFADYENAMVYGEYEALELLRPGFLSQLPDSISHVGEEKKWHLTLRVVRFAIWCISD